MSKVEQAAVDTSEEGHKYSIRKSLGRDVCAPLFVFVLIFVAAGYCSLTMENEALDIDVTVPSRPQALSIKKNGKTIAFTEKWIIGKRVVTWFGATTTPSRYTASSTSWSARFLHCNGNCSVAKETVDISSLSNKTLTLPDSFMISTAVIIGFKDSVLVGFEIAGPLAIIFLECVVLLFLLWYALFEVCCAPSSYNLSEARLKFEVTNRNMIRWSKFLCLVSVLCVLRVGILASVFNAKAWQQAYPAGTTFVVSTPLFESAVTSLVLAIIATLGCAILAASAQCNLRSLPADDAGSWRKRQVIALFRTRFFLPGPLSSRTNLPWPICSVLLALCPVLLALVCPTLTLHCICVSVSACVLCWQERREKAMSEPGYGQCSVSSHANQQLSVMLDGPLQQTRAVERGSGRRSS
jgi:hypothetical protein